MKAAEKEKTEPPRIGSSDTNLKYLKYYKGMKLNYISDVGIQLYIYN